MAQTLISKSRYLRVQNYGSALSINIPKEFTEALQFTKGSNVRAWIDDGIFHAEKAQE